MSSSGVGSFSSSPRQFVPRPGGGGGHPPAYSRFAWPRVRGGE